MDDERNVTLRDRPRERGKHQENGDGEKRCRANKNE